MFMVPDLASDIEVETCRNGVSATHVVGTAWTPDSGAGIVEVLEPRVEGMPERYEMFGGVLVMEMTVNHIDEVLRVMGDPGPARWLQPHEVAHPRLVIAFVERGTWASSVFSVGSAISKINDQEVRTLEEYRANFAPRQGSALWSLETDLGLVMHLHFNESVAAQYRQGLAMPSSRHLLTDAVVAAAERLGLAEHGVPRGWACDSNCTAATGGVVALNKAPREAPRAAPVARAAGPLLVDPAAPGRRRASAGSGARRAAATAAPPAASLPWPVA